MAFALARQAAAEISLFMVVLHSNPSLRASDSCINHLRPRMMAAILRVLHTHPGFFPSVKIEERVPLPKVRGT